MRHPGRKSAAELSMIGVHGNPKRLEAPSTLSDPERNLFVSIVEACDARHFTLSDVPLLSRYCEAAVLADEAARELRRGAVIDGKPSPWIVVQEKSVRALVSLSARLRLAPQSRTEAKTTARRMPESFDRPWEDGNAEASRQ